MHSLDAKCVRDLLDMFKKVYSNFQPPLVHLCAMLGVVNALGAGGGNLFLHCPLSFAPSNSKPKESSYITGPLFSNSFMELSLTSLVQDIFLVAQHSVDNQLQHYASRVVSFLRHYIWSSDLHNEGSAKPNSASQPFPEDSVVMKFSLWLMNLNCSGAIGFLVRLGFQDDRGSFRFQATKAHPFVKCVICLLLYVCFVRPGRSMTVFLEVCRFYYFHKHSPCLSTREVFV